MLMIWAIRINNKATTVEVISIESRGGGGGGEGTLNVEVIGMLVRNCFEKTLKNTQILT